MYRPQDAFDILTQIYIENHIAWAMSLMAMVINTQQNPEKEKEYGVSPPYMKGKVNGDYEEKVPLGWKINLPRPSSPKP